MYCKVDGDASVTRVTFEGRIEDHAGGYTPRFFCIFAAVATYQLHNRRYTQNKDLSKIA
jgi:hypothetical protein